MDHLHRSVRDEYSEHAGTYDARWSLYVERSVMATYRYLDLPRGSRLLDVGCGTGAMLDQLLVRRPDLLLTGVDLSPAMLAVARDRLSPPVRLVEASALALPFVDHSFDALVSVSSLHYWPDPMGCLAELRRVLRPHARLVLTDWCDDYLTCKLCVLYLRLTGRPHFHVFGLRGLTDLLDQAGFRDIDAHRYRITWLWGLMTVVARAP